MVSIGSALGGYEIQRRISVYHAARASRAMFSLEHESRTIEVATYTEAAAGPRLPCLALAAQRESGPAEWYRIRVELVVCTVSALSRAVEACLSASPKSEDKKLTSSERTGAGEVAVVSSAWRRSVIRRAPVRKLL